MKKAPVLTDDRLKWWGSDCSDCGNATPGSMRCDDCRSDRHTSPLYVLITGRG